jgi:2-oxoglutarate ferredoxin oxidoreductase subunit gamma
MQYDFIFSGFGGQGTLFAGQILAYSAMDYGKEVTWIPSYGPEMRGGTANCTVIVSDEEIGSPLVKNPSAVVAMNRPSLDKYEPMISPGGILVINSSMVDRQPVRTDIKTLMVPGNEIAEQIAEKRLTNMVLLGALLANLPVLPLEAVEAGLKAHLPARHQRFLPMNFAALRKGAEFIAEPIK